MRNLSTIEDTLRARPRTWLVTGAAGFIGSNLVERLLELGQHVIGLDNFATGQRRNLCEVVAGWMARTHGQGIAALRNGRPPGPSSPGGAIGRRGSFRFLKGDIGDPETCREACRGVDVVLHQAAIGSVPRSIDDPLRTHRANVDGFLHMLLAARDAGVRRFVYAVSSSIYGDHTRLPKVEHAIGRPLSPYAVSKRVNELYAGVFQRHYGLEAIGLRYFNVFGRRQDPDGPYAAVIPRWVRELLGGEQPRIFGDGETSRDFCYIENVLQANLLAALAPPEATDQVYNIACQDRTTLNELFGWIRDALAPHRPAVRDVWPRHEAFRPGDVRHSWADISKARRWLGYEPTHSVEAGLREAIGWYVANLTRREGAREGEAA